MPIVLALLAVAGVGGVAFAATRPKKSAPVFSKLPSLTAKPPTKYASVTVTAPKPSQSTGQKAGAAAGTNACNALGLGSVSGVCGSIGAKVGGKVEDAAKAVAGWIGGLF